MTTTTPRAVPDLHAASGPRLLGNLRDPAAFCPERWMDDAPAADGPPAPPYLPFGTGPRFCPGRNLALIEARLVTAMAAGEFDLTPDTSAGPVTERSSFTVFPERMAVTLRAR